MGFNVLLPGFLMFNQVFQWKTQVIKMMNVGGWGGGGGGQHLVSKAYF